MNKTLKGIIIAVVSVAVLAGLTAGGLLIYKKASAGAVKVFPLNNFGYYGGGMMDSQTNGMVTLDNMQQVMISDTQKINEIFVTEGQEVRKGDPLMSFDTTLSDIQLKKAEINVERAKLQLDKARKELRAIGALSPHYSQLVTPEPLGIVYEPHETKVVVAGDGTADSPYYYLWDEADTLCQDDLRAMLGAVRAVDPEANEVWVTFIVRENNALNAPVLRSFGLLVTEEKNEAGESSLTWGFYEPVLSEDILAYEEEPAPYYNEGGSPYTSREIEQMKKAQEQTVNDLELSLRMAQVELERMQLEVNDGTVISKVDGVVKEIRDPDEVTGTGEALMTVSGGGGFLIEASMNEMELGKLNVGDTVSVQSWQTGEMFEGTVVETSLYPASDANSWTNGNQNVSYYPFKVSVSEEANLHEYEWAGVSYSTSSAETGFYMEKMFVRTENGRNYVMVENGEGRLEKRFISTGSSQWESILITGGLSFDSDWIAFPYGNDTVEGARCEHAEINELYGGMY